jgi:hypothetical protein
VNTVTFSEEVALANIIGRNMRCRRGAGAVLVTVDHIWKIVGVRHGSREVGMGMGLKGWCWMKSITYDLSDCGIGGED